VCRSYDNTRWPPRPDGRHNSSSAPRWTQGLQVQTLKPAAKDAEGHRNLVSQYFQIAVDAICAVLLARAGLGAVGRSGLFAGRALRQAFFLVDRGLLVFTET